MFLPDKTMTADETVPSVRAPRGCSRGMTGRVRKTRATALTDECPCGAPVGEPDT